MPPTPRSTPSLTLAEARARAAALAVTDYRVDLDLTEPASGSFGSRSTVRFTPSVDATFLELADAEGVTVTVEARPSTRRTTGCGWP